MFGWPQTPKKAVQITENGQETPKVGLDHKNESKSSFGSQWPSIYDLRKFLSHDSSESSEDCAVIWQWEHKEGWRKFDPLSINRMETAYQSGQTHVRLKSGKMGVTPMEVFFVDMIQWNPITGKVRSLQRLGADPCWGRLSRFLRGLIRSWETGKPRTVKFSDYSGRKLERTEAGLVRRDPRNMNSADEVDRIKKSERCYVWSTRVVNSSWFFPLSMFAIIANTVYLSIDADFNPDDTVSYTKFSWFSVCENLFCIFFAAELCVRFGAYKGTSKWLSDYWFIFDSILVLFMVVETWIIPLVLLLASGEVDTSIKEYSVLRIARLLKLSRLGRLVRLLRIFPEVMTMLKGIKHAARSVFFTLVLLFVLLLIFGILFKIQTERTALEDLFSSVPKSMWILLIHGAFLDDLADVANEVLETSPALVAVFLVFIFLSSFTVLNMLIGIVVNVVYQISEEEKEQASVSSLKDSLLELLECFDANDDRLIDWDEYELLMQNPELKSILKKFGVDCLDMTLLKDVLFDSPDAANLDNERTLHGSPTSPTPERQHERKLTFDEFVEVVIRLRGGNNASVMDIVELRESIRLQFQRLENFHQGNIARLEKLSQHTGLSVARTISNVVHENSSDANCSSSAKPPENGQSPAKPDEKKEPWERELEALQAGWQAYYNRFRQDQLETTQERRHADLLGTMCSMQEAQRQHQMQHVDILEKISSIQTKQQHQDVQHTIMSEKIHSIEKTLEVRHEDMMAKIHCIQKTQQLQESRSVDMLEKLCSMQKTQQQLLYQSIPFPASLTLPRPPGEPMPLD